MSLKKNVIANYVGQFYTIGVSILTLPELIKQMGAEAYGLVGFFTLLQSWLMLMDLGMSPTLSREISRYRGGALSESNLLHLFRVFRRFFIGLAILSAVVFIALSDYISTKWLNIETLDQRVVKYVLGTIALNIAFRWIAGIYKAAITGFEKLVWLSKLNAIFATFRFAVVFLVFQIFGASSEVFFTYQIFISLIELIVLIWYVSKLMPKETSVQSVQLRPLRQLFSFSATIAFTSAVWVIVTQTDKLILSKLLPLSDFGYYTLAVQIAGSITILSGAVSSAIIPRLAKLEAENKQAELIGLYKNATQMIVVAVGACSLILIFFSKEVLYVWTGDNIITEKVSPYLILYTIGNFFMIIAAFPYYLQYAKGNLRFHLKGSIGFLIYLIPVLFYTVRMFGGIAAGYVWISVNFLYLFLWVPFIHNYFEKKLNRNWFLHDVFKVILPALLAAYIFTFFVQKMENRLLVFCQLAIVGLLILSICIIFSDNARRRLKDIIQNNKKNNS